MTPNSKLPSANPSTLQRVQTLQSPADHLLDPFLTFTPVPDDDDGVGLVTCSVLTQAKAFSMGAKDYSYTAVIQELVNTRDTTLFIPAKKSSRLLYLFITSSEIFPIPQIHHSAPKVNPKPQSQASPIQNRSFIGVLPLCHATRPACVNQLYYQRFFTSPTPSAEPIEACCLRRPMQGSHPMHCIVTCQFISSTSTSSAIPSFLSSSSQSQRQFITSRRKMHAYASQHTSCSRASRPCPFHHCRLVSHLGSNLQHILRLDAPASPQPAYTLP
jgi:hypothetical protein